MKASDEPAPDGMQKANDAPITPSHDKPITRRDFVSGIAKLIAIGALSHFGLLAGKALAGETDCDCASEDSNDWCPYGGDGDKCEPEKGNEDVCRDGSDVNDKCPNGSTAQDTCALGQAPDDQCPGGTIEAGDSCQGGGDKTGGQEQDNCDPKIADSDKCNGGGTGGSGGTDNCKENEEGKSSDNCSDIFPIDDDTCYKGNNGPEGNNGGNDWCTSVKYQATDACADGSEAQDLCEDGFLGHADDECVGEGTDRCGDVKNDTDKCYGGAAPEDACPEGKQDDICSDCEEGSDDCRPGRESDDRDDKGGSRG